MIAQNVTDWEWMKRDFPARCVKDMVLSIVTDETIYFQSYKLHKGCREVQILINYLCIADSRKDCETLAK